MNNRICFDLILIHLYLAAVQGAGVEEIIIVTVDSMKDIPTGTKALANLYLTVG